MTIQLANLPAVETIYVVDSDPAVVRVLATAGQLLNLPVQPCASPVEFLDLHARSAAGCLVLDLKTPILSGIEVQQKLSEEKIEIPLIMVSGQADVRMAVEVMSRGAMTFLEKPLQLEEVIPQIRRALEVDAARRTARLRQAANEAQLAQLTPKEREVLEFISAGKTNKQIAAELHLSIRAVEDRRARLMKKLGVRSVAELVQWRTMAERSAS